MKLHIRRSGAILFEFLFAIMASLLIGASLIVLIQCTNTSQTVVMSAALSDAAARKTMDTLTAHLSNAQPYQISSSPLTYSVLSAGAASSVTCYTNSAGDTERYWLDTTTTPRTLKRTVTISGVATTTVVVNGLQTLQLTYYLTNGTNYTAASWISNTTAPSASNLPAVGAIGITATVTINGVQQQLSSFVRLRNSPYRS